MEGQDKPNYAVLDFQKILDQDLKLKPAKPRMTMYVHGSKTHRRNGSIERRSKKEADKQKNKYRKGGRKILDIDEIEQEDRQLFNIMGVIDDFYSDAVRPSLPSSLQTSEQSLDRDSSSDDEITNFIYNKYHDPDEPEAAANKLSKRLEKVANQEEI